MQDKIKDLQSQFENEIMNAKTINDIYNTKSQFIGKNGKLNQLFALSKSMPDDKKKEISQKINNAKQSIVRSIETKISKINQMELKKKLKEDTKDITLPYRENQTGKSHPISNTISRVKKIMHSMGFSSEEGPQIETDDYNFNHLNIDENHPARTMFDTFYINSSDKLLRTHTSPVQIRAMQNQGAPIKIIAIGKVYRSDHDATHSPMFHQMEGLFIDKNVTMANLKWTLKNFLKQFFGKDNLAIRMRPSFFPFTEPSVEVDVNYKKNDDGSITIGTGDLWMEILGAGMVHPNVLLNCKIDPNQYQGFAFGIGIDRITMLYDGIDDLRTMFDSDKNWLNYFGKTICQ